MGFRVWVWNLGFSFGVQVWGLGFRDRVSRFGFLGSGFRFRFSVFGCRCEGFGFRDSGLDFTGETRRTSEGESSSPCGARCVQNRQNVKTRPSKLLSTANRKDVPGDFAERSLRLGPVRTLFRCIRGSPEHLIQIHSGFEFRLLGIQSTSSGESHFETLQVCKLSSEHLQHRRIFIRNIRVNV